MACRDSKKVSLCILQMISRLIIIDITNVSNRLYLLIKCKLYIFPGLLSGTKNGSGAQQTRDRRRSISESPGGIFRQPQVRHHPFSAWVRLSFPLGNGNKTHRAILHL